MGGEGRGKKGKEGEHRVEDMLNCIGRASIGVDNERQR